MTDTMNGSALVPGESTRELNNTRAGIDHNATEAGAITELLRALLAAPAACVLAAVEDLDRHDVYDDHHRIILDALTELARQQVTAGDESHPVPVTAVQLDLQRSGVLSHGRVAPLLIEATTGTPAPLVWLPALIDGLRRARLRRAVITVAGALAEAGRTGAVDDLTTALLHLPQLMDVARRAGIEVPR